MFGTVAIKSAGQNWKYQPSPVEINGLETNAQCHDVVMRLKDEVEV